MMLTAFFMQTFSSLVIVADYYGDTSTFVKSCENKTKPWLHCNGKCQMIKRIEQQEKSNQDNPEKKAATRGIIVLSSKSFFASQIDLLSFITIIDQVTPLSLGVTRSRSYSIFHPPQTVRTSIVT